MKSQEEPGSTQTLVTQFGLLTYISNMLKAAITVKLERACITRRGAPFSEPGTSRGDSSSHQLTIRAHIAFLKFTVVRVPHKLSHSHIICKGSQLAWQVAKKMPLVPETNQALVVTKDFSFPVYCHCME